CPVAAGKADHQPDEERQERDVQRGRDPLPLETPCRRLGRTIMRRGIGDRLVVDHQRLHTNSAQATSVSTTPPITCQRTICSRPTGSSIRPESQTKCFTPPSMWWNRLHV